MGPSSAFRTACALRRSGTAQIQARARIKAEQVTVSEELKRVIEPIEGLHANFPRAIISIDTYRSLVATEAVAAGASSSIGHRGQVAQLVRASA